jgi:hypothetical protein
VGIGDVSPLPLPYRGGNSEIFRVMSRNEQSLRCEGPRVRRLSAGAKEIRTLRPTLNASVPRGATWVPRTAPGFGVAPPSS